MLLTSNVFVQSDGVLGILLECVTRGVNHILQELSMDRECSPGHFENRASRKVL